MNESGITKYLLKLAKMITRSMWGGLAQINILLSTMFIERAHVPERVRAPFLCCCGA